ncbi:hypothetical protein DPMN_172145 [Dreissena polymorpha]|uniref:Uncharacterized protein n=1 Tax=Dreissena polymorpha TaxID=45954 RepID=A0A9D4E113_DREPO|nr:hypothetical protein DPMN_172145 [Dreissena polymorpha]
MSQCGTKCSTVIFEEPPCRGWQSGLRRAVTLKGLHSIWYHWNGKKKGDSRWLHASSIILKMVRADERASVDS